MKKILEKIVQLRNPQFKFDANLSSWVLIELCIQKAYCLLRGLIATTRRARKFNFLLLGKRVSFFNFRQIELGKWVKIENDVRLSGLGKGKLRIGDGSGIGAFSQVEISTSFNNLGEHITIGDNVGIGAYAYLGGAGGLTIGDGCIIGQYFSCHPENHNFKQVDTPIRYQGVSRNGIRIGKNCWIGAKVTILDGVEIGDNCVIAAGAVVTKSMPAHSVIGGVPAKVLKRYAHISRVQEYNFEDPLYQTPKIIAS